MKHIKQNNMSNKEILVNLAINSRNAYLQLSNINTIHKNNALITASKYIKQHQEAILNANKQDIEFAKSKNHNTAFIDRLTLNKERIEGMCNTLIAVSELDDPVGKITYQATRPNGLTITRKTIPLGVIGIIYEARPNVTADSWALCIKSGNAAILRPGSESYNTSKKIMEILQQATIDAKLPQDSIAILPSSDRELVDIMLELDEYIDVIVPRGGKNLITAVSNKSKIPVFKHLDGNCHTYIHQDADLDKAINILHNAKLRRPGICGATESVVIDQQILPQIIPLIEKKFAPLNCEIRADKTACSYSNYFKLATEQDFYTEYLDKVFSIKTVSGLDEAIAHINQYSSKHTEAIITENETAKENFLALVDSAIVMHNTSTQFADGGEFGLGAEIGISTGRMHARGPVGLEQLVTYKYLVQSNGEIRN